MNRVLFRQPGLFAQLKRQNGGLMAAHHHTAISHGRINGSKKGPVSFSQKHYPRVESKQ